MAMSKCENTSRLDLLLIGITGSGKSELGNSILGWPAFGVCIQSSSATQEVGSEYVQRDNLEIRVIDTPGLEDTNLSKGDDRQRASDNMGKIMSLFGQGLSAFLFVVKFGTRFTEEDKQCVESFKGIFGKNFLKDFGILIVTGGDIFNTTARKVNLSFEGWCNNEKGALKALIDECKPRRMLFNNMEEDPEKKGRQIQELLRYARTVQERKSRYNNILFTKCVAEREKFVLKMKLPMMKEKFQREISLLDAELYKITGQNLSEDQLMASAERLQERIQSLKNKIREEDKGYGMMKDEISTVKRLETIVEELKKSIREKKTAAMNENIANLKERVNELRRKTNSSRSWHIAKKVGAVAAVGGIGVGVLVLEALTLGLATPVADGMVGAATAISVASVATDQLHYNLEEELSAAEEKLREVQSEQFSDY